MNHLSLFVAATVMCASTLVSHGDGRAAPLQPQPDAARKTQPGKRLSAFTSERELTDYLRKISEAQKRRIRPMAMAAPATAPMAAAPPSPAGLAGSADKPESITNVQHAGVDEGGIVKAHGDHLVVLRRGRLFTIRIGSADLTPVSAVDAFAPDIEPGGSWYDEMLIADDTVVVIGYSYQRGGTEIGLFDINAQGGLRYRSTYHLRSNDYYSSRNYSSRLIGQKLIFYSGLDMPFYLEDPAMALPALRKWQRGADAAGFRRIVTASRVYRAERPLDMNESVALHTVTVCDLARVDLECEATTVIGPDGRVFYVSPQSVYVWASPYRWRNDGKRPAPSLLYRMPLDGAAPSAVQVTGSPVDQFSFLESNDDHLNVLVRADAVGDGMWGAEVAAGDIALLRLPFSRFADGSTSAPAADYRDLPNVEGYAFHNRFVAGHLLYGGGSGWGRPQQKDSGALYAVRWSGGGEAQHLTLSHGVDRIEVLGSDAVVIGTSGQDLHFTPIRLGDRASVAGAFVRPDASQGELRSHGFFYKPDGPNGGLLGLPVRGPGRPGYSHLFRDSASIVFLRNAALRFSEVGDLEAQAEGAVDDGCRASCVDWYGNARPLFIGGRVLALLGYEIVEGAVVNGRMREVRRVNYAPRSPRSDLQ